MLGTTFRAWAVAMIAAMTMALNGYDSSTFNSVQGYASFVNHFKEDGEAKIRPNILGAVNTAYTCGGIVSGFLIVPTISRLLGRRIPIQMGCLLVIISTFVQVFAPNMPGFIGGRLIMGIGQGLAVPIGPTYIVEMAPARIRGTMMSLWQLWYTIGAFIVYWAAYGTQKGGSGLGLWQWRVPIMLQIVMPTFVILGLLWAPESPRWLAERGREEEALKSLSFTRPASDADNELADIIAAVTFERETIDKNTRWYTPYLTLFREPSLRRRAFVALFLNGGQQVCGNGMLQSYATLIYKSVFSDDNTIFLINALSATCSIVFTLQCTYWIDRAGRKPILLVGAVGQGLSLLIVAIIGITHPADAEGHRTRAIGMAVAAMFFVFILFYKPSWGATVWIVTADIFSTNVRAHAVAMASQTQAVVNTILNQFFPTFLANCGFYTFFFFAGMNIFLFTGVWFFVPETKGVPLEEIDKLFGAENHKLAGETLVQSRLEEAKFSGHAEGEKHDDALYYEHNKV